MAVPLTGTGGLFTRIGLCGGLLNSINNYRSSVVPPKVDTLQAQFQSNDQAVIDNIYTSLLSFQQSMGGFPSQISSLAQNIVITMVNDDEPQVNRSLATSLKTLIGQMKASAEYVSQSTVSSSVAAAGTNNGNANVIVSLRTRGGRFQENCFAETIVGTVVADSQSGGTTAGRESLTFQGQQAVSDPLSWLYPIGSGASAGITCVDASQSQAGGNGNYLRNSNFETWTVADTPDGWNIIAGSAGTQILQSSAEAYDGTWSLQLVGDATAASLYQEFSQAGILGDTSAQMAPIDQVAFLLYAKVDVAPAAGELEIALVDGEGTVLEDIQGNQNLVTADLTTLGTTFVPVSGFFRTPRVMPASVRLRIRLSTALSSGSNLFIDHLALTQPIQMYQGGPVIAVFSGNTKLITGDSFTVTVSNDYLGQFQRLFDKFFNMKQLGYLLPSSGSPTISDSLIT